MGFLSRSVSLMRYRLKEQDELKEQVKGQFWEYVEFGVKRGAYKEMETSTDVVAIGWTSIDDFTSYDFENASYIFANYVALCLRVDTVTVPSKVVELHFRQQRAKLLKERGQNKLSAAQSRDLKDQVKETLKKQMLPSVNLFDVVWNTAEDLVYFTNLGVKARERFEDHFRKSFGLTLIPLIPYIRGFEILGEEEGPALESLQPSSLIR